MIDKRVYELDYIRGESYLSERLEGNQYKKLAYVRKQRPDAYACLVEATRNLK